jgi:hypothetical protein
MGAGEDTHRSRASQFLHRLPLWRLVGIPNPHPVPGSNPIMAGQAGWLLLDRDAMTKFFLRYRNRFTLKYYRLEFSSRADRNTFMFAQVEFIDEVYTWEA